MIADGCGDARSLARRVKAMEDWLASPKLLAGDADAEYAAVIDINLDEMVRAGSSAARTTRMTPNPCPTSLAPRSTKVHRLLHDQHRSLPRRRQAARPARDILVALAGTADQDGRAAAHEEGHYNTLPGTAGARMEMPGCSLCMGNQAQIKEGATAMSTSTRNFPNCLGKNTNVYLGSAELAAVLEVGPHPDQGGIPGRRRSDQRRGQQDLPLHELQRNAGVRGMRVNRWRPDQDRQHGCIAFKTVPSGSRFSGWR